MDGGEGREGPDTCDDETAVGLRLSGKGQDLPAEGDAGAELPLVQAVTRFGDQPDTGGIGHIGPEGRVRWGPEYLGGTDAGPAYGQGCHGHTVPSWGGDFTAEGHLGRQDGITVAPVRTADGVAVFLIFFRSDEIAAEDAGPAVPDRVVHRHGYGRHSVLTRHAGGKGLGAADSALHRDSLTGQGLSPALQAHGDLDGLSVAVGLVVPVKEGDGVQVCLFLAVILLDLDRIALSGQSVVFIDTGKAVQVV